MFQLLGLVFTGLILWQTAAKKLEMPLPSRGLEVLKEHAVAMFEELGVLVSNCLNLYRLFENIRRFLREIWRIFISPLLRMLRRILRRLRRIWRFIVDHIWGNIKPFFDSCREIAVPAWKLLFSWGYFFVGFAQTHYLIFSYIGGAIVLGSTAYFSHSMGIFISTPDVDARYVVAVVVAATIGLTIAYPGILLRIFPSIERCGDAVYDVLDPPTNFRLNGQMYSMDQLLRMRLSELTELLHQVGSNTDGLPRRKTDYIDRLRRYAQR